MHILELITEAEGKHPQLILMRCPSHLEVSPAPQARSRFPEGRSLLPYEKWGRDAGEMKVGRDAGEMKAMTFHHRSQACFSVGLQGSVVGSVYTSSYHCEVI